MSGNKAPVGRTYEEFRREYEAEQVLSLRDILQMVKSYWWVLVLVVITCGGLAAGFSLIRTPMYQANTKVLVEQDYLQPGSGLDTTLQGLQILTQTMVETAKTSAVAEEVAQRLDVPESAETIQANLQADNVEKTSYFEVRYEDPDPVMAQLIANTTSEVVAERAPELAPGGEINSVHATVQQEATLPEDPVRPATERNIGVGLALGLILGFGLVFLLAYLDKSWRSLEEVEEVSGTPNLAAIPTFKTQRT
jgi:capsular polysaccharide biosynthesis protein